MNSITTAFPNLCSLLAGSELDDDISVAIDIASAGNGEEELRSALEAEMFAKNELMWWLCGEALLSCGYPEAIELEAALTAVSHNIAHDVVRAAYRDKLLVNDKDALEDTLYELVVAARAIEMLDAESVEIEKKIEGTENNSDLYGLFKGQKVRIEVTVLHESLQPTCHMEFDELVREADIPCGFTLSLRLVLETKEHAERVRALVELLHGEHDPDYEFKDRNETVTIEVDGTRFTRLRKGPYRCSQRESHIDSVLFEDSADIREVRHPVFTRSMTPKAVREDFQQPDHVFTSEHLPHDPDTHNDNPLSGKIGEALGKKRRQCEAGAVNVIAFCNPLPMNDDSFLDTLYGTTMPIVPFKEDKDGVRQFQGVERFRNHKAPFVPFADIPVDGLTDEQKDQLEEDRQQFAIPFAMMSAVWLFRRGWYKRQVCLPNPNADCPIPLELARAMTDSAETSSKSNAAQGSIENSATVEESEDELVWVEMADEFVTGCRTLEAAETAFGELKSSGRTLDEIQTAFHRVEPRQPGWKGEQMFVEPTHEELAMNFVINCGGFEMAEACLAEWKSQQ